MKEKTQIEKNAEEKQIALLSAALREASNAAQLRRPEFRMISIVLFNPGPVT